MHPRMFPDHSHHTPGHQPGGPDLAGRGRAGFGPGGFGAGFPFEGGFPGWRGHGGPRGGRARKGDVRAAILSLLAEQPSNGYGLIKSIADKTEGVWRPSPGSVYPTLQQLVDEGLIEPADAGSPRTEYRLTDAGRAHVEEHAEELDAAWDSASRTLDAHGDMFAAVGKLLGVVKQVAQVGSAEQRAATTAKLDELRRDLYRMLGE